MEGKRHEKQCNRIQGPASILEYRRSPMKMVSQKEEMKKRKEECTTATISRTEPIP